MARHKKQPDRRRARGTPKPFPVYRGGVLERYACDVELPKSPGGARNRQRVYGKTEAECAANVRALVVSHDQGEERQAESYTLETYGAWWLDHVKRPNVLPQTLENYSGHLTKHVYPTLGSKPLGRISTEQLQTLLVKISRTSPGIVEEVAILLRGMFRYAVAARPQRRKDNPMDGVVVPHHDARRSRPLTVAELNAFLKVLAGTAYEGAFWLSICSLRAAEVCGAQWGDLHLDGDTPHMDVRRQVVRSKAGLVLTDTLKTDASHRRVYLLPQAVTALRAQHARDAKAQLKSGRRSPQIIVPARKPLMDPSTLWRYFKKLLVQAGLPADIHLHDLRATYATLAHQSGAAMRDVQAQLGHSTPATTMKYYTHATDEGQQDTAQRVAKKLGDKTG